MAKETLSFTEDELERQFAEAERRGRERHEQEPRAESAYYDRASGRVVVKLTNGCSFMFPTELAQGLRGADPKLIAEVEIEPHGFALHWEKLDADLTIAGMLTGMFGTRAWMTELGRAGGSVTSEAKAKSSRLNGAKGGRPRNKKTA